MADYDRKNTFIFSKNDRKESEKHPDLTGTFTDENGVEMEMSIWAKEKNGRRFFTGNIKPKRERRQEAAGGAVPFDDSMPF